MSNDEHKDRRSLEETQDLLRLAIEVGAAGNETLGQLSAKLDTILCVLEHISQNTCETLNEIHELMDSDECGTRHEPKDPCAEREDGDPARKRHRRCEYRPCEPTEEGGGSRASLSGSAAPYHVFGAPYPPSEPSPEPESRANEVPAPHVPRGPFRGFLIPGDQMRPLDFKSKGDGEAGDDPVVFGEFTLWGSDGPVRSKVAADISGAESGIVVLATANKYVSYSTDAGSNFTSLNPTTIFDNTADGGFCCDQIVQYIPSIDRFIWLMQFATGANGKNRVRIAAASPEAIVSSNCTSWTYWDLTSDGLGVTTTAADVAAGNHWLDYPNMSVGTNSLYISVDNVGLGGATPPTGGRIIARVPLGEIQSGSTINYRYTHWADAGRAYAGHVTQNTGDEAYWAGSKNNSTLQVFNWPESSISYSWRDVGVINWPNGTLSSTAKDGNDWLTKASSFPGSGVIGATRVGNEIWFAWMASSGAGAPGGFTFPNANVQVVKIDPTNGYKRLDQFAIWNNDYAFAYPALATNDHNEVGIVLGWGGKTFYANSAVGILGDFVVWYPALSDASTTRWGDYVTARRASPQTGLFAGFGYSIDTTNTGVSFDPFYVLFGRNSVVNPERGGDIK